MPLPRLQSGAVEAISQFIKDVVENAGAKGIVLGLSGGLDSSVTALLCSKAIGGERVLGISMPDSNTREEDVIDAKEVAKLAKIKFKVISIQRILDSFVQSVGTLNKVSLGNLKARIRMCILYSQANELGYLVAGTSNKTEILLGYFTKYGDGGSDFMPLGDLYKTQVRDLARELGVPERILKKKPSAGLYPGQYDEEELGHPYEVLDSVLYSYFELGIPKERIAEELKISLKDVESILNMVYSSYHKRRTPYILKLSLRTPGVDFD